LLRQIGPKYPPTSPMMLFTSNIAQSTVTFFGRRYIKIKGLQIILLQRNINTGNRPWSYQCSFIFQVKKVSHDFGINLHICHLNRNVQKIFMKSTILKQYFLIIFQNNGIFSIFVITYKIAILISAMI